MFKLQIISYIIFLFLIFFYNLSLNQDPNKVYKFYNQFGTQWACPHLAFYLDCFFSRHREKQRGWGSISTA